MLTRTLVLNDPHLPFHDSRLITISGEGMVLDILEDTKCDRLVINGDLGDLYSWNSYGIHPDVQIDQDTELYLLKCFLENLRERFPDLEIIFLFGNHEHRYERWVIEKARAMHNRCKLEAELTIKELDIEFYHYNYRYRLENTNLYIQHSPPSYGVNGARTSLLAKPDQSAIYGCTHRQQHSTITGGSGEVYEVYFNGWLGSATETPSHEKVFSYRKGHQNWQQCFSIVTVIDGTEFQVNQYAIRNHRTVVDGHLYDYSEKEIRDELQYTKELYDGRAESKSKANETDPSGGSSRSL